MDTSKNVLPVLVRFHGGNALLLRAIMYIV